MVCHDVVRLVLYYLHGREVGLPTGGMPRCHDFGYIISTVVRSGYRRVVCHDVVSLVIYYLHGREVGLPTGGMPRCREFGYILFPRS